MPSALDPVAVDGVGAEVVIAPSPSPKSLPSWAAAWPSDALAIEDETAAAEPIIQWARSPVETKPRRTKRATSMPLAMTQPQETSVISLCSPSSACSASSSSGGGARDEQSGHFGFSPSAVASSSSSVSANTVQDALSPIASDSVADFASSPIAAAANVSGFGSPIAVLHESAFASPTSVLATVDESGFASPLTAASNKPSVDVDASPAAVRALTSEFASPTAAVAEPPADEQPLLEKPLPWQAPPPLRAAAVDGGLSLLESMHELSLGEDDEFDATSAAPLGSPTPASASAHDSSSDSEAEVSAEGFMHDMSIDAQAQMHAHQNWTPFMQKAARRRRRAAAHGSHSSSDLGSSDFSAPSSVVRDASSFHTPARRGHGGQSLDIDLSAITPMRHSRTSSDVMHEDMLPLTPFSPVAASNVTSPTHAKDDHGPFVIPTEEQCDAFFRDRALGLPREPFAGLDDVHSPRSAGLRLYDPATDQLGVESGMTRVGGRVTDGDQEPHEGEDVLPDFEQLADPSSPSREQQEPMPFGSPCSPLLAPRHASAFDGAEAPLCTLEVDSSFSFSPAPKSRADQQQTQTETLDKSMPHLDEADLAPKTPSKPAASLIQQQAPVSILKTPLPSSKAAPRTPAMPFASPALAFSPPSTVFRVNDPAPFEGFMSPISASGPVQSSIAPFATQQQPIFGAAAVSLSAAITNHAAQKVVRFDVPPSHNTTVDSLSASSAEAPLIPAPAMEHSFGSMPFVQELSMFDATALEASHLQQSRSFGAQRQPAAPFVMPTAVSSNGSFTIGLSEIQAEELRVRSASDSFVAAPTPATLAPHQHANPNATLLSHTMSSFFVPFERLDQSHAAHASTSSTPPTSSSPAAFKIIVDGPDSSATTTTNGPSAFPEASFHSSSSDSSRDASAVDNTPRGFSRSARTATTTTPAFLRVPGRRSNAASATPRVPITRAHTSSARVIRVHSRFHRKQRDPLTGRKHKRSMRIFPSASTGHSTPQANLSRTLTFEDTPPMAAPNSNLQQHHASTSPSPSRKHLDFSDERLVHDDSGFGFSYELNHSNADASLDQSASRDLSETFEHITVLASPNQTHAPAAARQPVMASPAFPSFAFSPAQKQQHAAPHFGSLSPVHPQPQHQPPQQHQHDADPNAPSLYAQHVMQSKLQALFHTSPRYEAAKRDLAHGRSIGAAWPPVAPNKFASSPLPTLHGPEIPPTFEAPPQAQPFWLPQQHPHVQQQQTQGQWAYPSQPPQQPMYMPCGVTAAGPGAPAQAMYLPMQMVMMCVPMGAPVTMPTPMTHPVPPVAASFQTFSPQMQPHSQPPQWAWQQLPQQHQPPPTTTSATRGRAPAKSYSPHAHSHDHSLSLPSASLASARDRLCLALAASTTPPPDHRAFNAAAAAMRHHQRAMPMPTPLGGRGY